MILLAAKGVLTVRDTLGVVIAVSGWGTGVAQPVWYSPDARVGSLRLIPAM